MKKTPTVLAAAVLAVAVSAPTARLHPVAEAAGAPAAGATVFEFDRLNRTYRMDDSQVAPVRQGPVTIHLSSPRNSLILKGHSVSLHPLGNGLYQASVGLDLLGSGDLTADLVTDAGTSSRLEDLVVVPRQTVRVDGRVSFQRVAGGWDVTALSLPPAVELDIQSRLAGSLVTLCGQMAVFLGLDCDGLDQSLSRVEVPLPPAGSVFYLPEAELTADEVARLEAYLAGL
jgi:hypothetical protein